MAGLDLVKIKLVKDRRLGDAVKIENANDAVKFLSKEMQDLDKEHLYILNLSTLGTVTNASLVSIGTIDTSLAHPREVLKTSILSNSRSMILLHNHPSGDCTPSQADRATCENIQAASHLMGIDLLDFIVVGDAGNFYSFNAYGEMPYTNTEDARKMMSQYQSEVPEEKTSGTFIERVVDGVPHKFELTEDEIKTLYSETIEKMHRDIEVKEEFEI